MPDKNLKAAAGKKADIEAAARLAARKDSQSKNASLDIGKQKGPFDTKDIRRSVHQWQATGPAPLAPSEADNNSNIDDDGETPAKPLKGSARQPAKLGVFAVKTVFPPPQNEAAAVSGSAEKMSRYASLGIDREVRMANVPKKRVVSDEHWMNTNVVSPKKETGKTADIADRQQRRPDAWVRPRPTPKPPKEPRPAPPPLEKEDIIKYFAGASHAYKPQPTPYVPGRAIVREKSSPAKADAEKEQNAQKDAAPNLEQSKDPGIMLAWLAGAPKNRNTNANAAAGRARAKSQGAAQATAAKVQTWGPGAGRISDWLGATSDPFGEDTETTPGHEKRTFSVADRHIAKDYDDFDDNDALSPRERERRDRYDSVRRKKSSGENRETRSSLRDEYDRGPASPSSTLKRRHARRSRSRLRAKSEAMDRENYNGSDMSENSLAGEERRPHSRKASKVVEGAPTNGNKLSHDAMISHNKGGLQRRLTTHDDLMSVLSAPRGLGKSFKSMRSNKLEDATFEEVVSSFRADESKYQRELKTLVDGVIPVLLKSVLSTSSATAKNLFGPGFNSANATAPIVNMGIALERLKSAHKRVQLGSEDSLLTWAQSTHPIYEDYLKTWRMGFQDVMVNLAPADNALATTATPGSWDVNMQENSGQYSAADGEKADVAFLLKRPLIRLKHLAKTFKAVYGFKPSDSAESMSTKFQVLVAEARRRQAEEQARLEDEAASSTDATRARDVNTLAPLAGVHVDPSRCVKARDLFDLKLQHSSGQLIDCRVEIILRYNRSNLDHSGGDLLVCEVDSSSRWLLFPPITVGRLSARHAPNGDLIVMIRGKDKAGADWHELLSLRSVDSAAIRDWTMMLGTSPVPPEIKRVKTFVERTEKPDVLTLTAAAVQAVPSEEIQVPIGEQASVISSNWRTRPASSVFTKRTVSTARDSVPPAASLLSEDASIPPSLDSRSTISGQTTTSMTESDRHSVHLRRLPRDASIQSPRSLNEALLRAQPSRPGIGRDTFEPPKEVPASELSTSSTPHDYNMVRKRMQGHSRYKKEYERSPSRTNFSVWMPPHSEVVEEQADPFFSPPSPQSRPDVLSKRPLHHRTSSVPGEQMPVVSRSRQSSPARGHQRTHSAAAVPMDGTSSLSHHTPAASPRSGHVGSPLQSPTQQAVPQSQDLVLRGASSTFFSTPSSQLRQQRSSSPLKQQYIPAEADELDDDDSSVDGQLMSDDDDDDASSITSNSSADDMLASLAPSVAYNKGVARTTAPSSVYSPKQPATVAPSQSASQMPERSTAVPFEHDKTIASLFCWSDKGSWDRVHPDECSVVISPGLIEAFELTSTHSHSESAGSKKQRPLVALELTPLVPLRRGTSIDISIRSPPTSESLLKPGNNIMFRSRTGQECERLYGLINQARINNPTYLALQDARPGAGFSGAGWAERMDRQRGPSSWLKLGRKGSSYRAGSSARRSLSYGASIAPSETSVASMSSAIMALKRFSGSKMFNVAKSTVTSRAGGRSASSAELSTSSGGMSGGYNSGSSTPLPVGLRAPGETPMGISGTKIRLYYRESSSKWRDMGSSRLTIMQPPRPEGAGPSLNRDGSVKKEMRIVVLGKHRGDTLLDVTLGESSFERVARTGIAVGMTEQHVGENGELGVVLKTGGVLLSKQRVYMLQMRSEAEAAYTFSLVGRLRY